MTETEPDGVRCRQFVPGKDALVGHEQHKNHAPTDTSQRSLIVALIMNKAFVLYQMKLHADFNFRLELELCMEASLVHLRLHTISSLVLQRSPS